MSGKHQNVEKTYKKVTQIEHILMRPDMYIGPVTECEELMWVLQDEELIQKKIKYIPGLYKIFDQILVNASDNYQRDKKMTKIQVSINKEQITVINDGKPIPVQIHKLHKIYVPQLIFGHLLTSSNYEDDEKKVTGGRNGYGAKLTNIFSNQFNIQIADSINKKLFKLKWSKNMTQISQPIIEPYNGNDYTKIQFRPDFKRFSINSITSDMMALLKRRVYDISAIIKVKVYLNSRLIPIPNFKEYVKKYLQNDNQIISQINTSKNSRWQVFVCRSDGNFMQVSFVNGISTSKGGSHVKHILDQITSKVISSVQKKNTPNIKPFQVKAHLRLFINCLIQNPSFDSQTKETLTTPINQFGSSCNVSDEFIKDLLKTGLGQRLISEVKLKQNGKIEKQLKRIKRNRLIIPKLQDANEAGKKPNCCLILTEGDSAKSLALCGIQQLGRDYYGVFPLKGKAANVKMMTPRQVMENAQLSNIVKILGLTFERQYSNTNDLRYGSVMIMADQDNDGSHIKGLIINFFQTFWPSLCRLKGFLKEFITPIIKCSKGNQTINFYSQSDYKRWRQERGESGWSIKYYKGLGTSTAKEAKQYFSRLIDHQIVFSYSTEADKKALELAFDKKNADMRKSWLREYDIDNCLDSNIKVVTIEDFVNKQLIHFSNSDNVRSIPSIMDGLKPSQRKILFACFKRNLTNEIKVAQLAGYVAQHSAYHHGEVSLCSTIIGMAQNFVGSNNLNLLEPLGQFGTRYQNGKDAASPRYIFTKLNALTRYLFNQADDHIIEYQQEENQMIQPKYYLPILPLVLINGAEGIGTGWSTTVYPHKVEDVVKLTRSKINQKQAEISIGWQNFRGTIQRDNKGGYIVSGNYEVDDENVTVTEIPVNKSIRDYKSFLEENLQSTQNQDPYFQDMKQYHQNGQIQFQITFIIEKMPSLSDLGRFLKLQANYQNSNMNLFTKDFKIKKYESINQIVDQFYEERIKGYSLRKRYLISKFNKQRGIIANQIKFINEIIEGQFKMIQSKDQWIQRLKNGRYARYQQLNKIYSTKNTEEDDNTKNKDYNYLLSMPIWSFCSQKIRQLAQIKNQLKAIIQYYQSISEKEMWLKDIDQFQNAWKAIEAGKQVKQPKNDRRKQKIIRQNGRNSLKRQNNGMKMQQSEDNSAVNGRKRKKNNKNLMVQQLQRDNNRQNPTKKHKNQSQIQPQKFQVPVQAQKKKQTVIDSILSKYLTQTGITKKNELSLLERIKARITEGDQVFTNSYNTAKESIAGPSASAKKEQKKEESIDEDDIQEYLL